MKSAAEAFIRVARAYIAWVDAAESGTAPVSFRDLHIALSQLQSAALKLPLVSDIELSDAADSIEKHTIEDSRRLCEVLATRLPVRSYGLVFDPLDEDDRVAVETTLDDDLTDVYWDIKDGIALADAGYHGDAVWHWRLLYFSHWGRHVVHAQSAVWQYLAENQDEV